MGDLYPYTVAAGHQPDSVGHLEVSVDCVDYIDCSGTWDTIFPVEMNTVSQPESWIPPRQVLSMVLSYRQLFIETSGVQILL